MAEYIEREAAINRLTKLFQLQAATARSIVEAIPAADVQPVVKARWIKMRFFPDWECERCGSVVSGNTPDPWNHYHFCPHCGARMDGGEE